MKKILFGLVLGAALMLSATALAGYPANSDAKTIGGSDCRMIVGGDNKLYPSYCNVDVSKVVDEDNICYVATGGSHKDIPAISCVKH